ncbi:matrixin family metalloprotease [Flavobacterium ginsengisoli]|uniref:matrixin family metalloprotease n=1 Tax=Flavobacterium ginsengisoli TaxID=871694 RepID=UPI0031E61224
MRKKITLLLFCIFGISQINAQILYDNGPIDNNPSFSLDGRKWDHTNLTYFFENGTNDIAGTDEKTALVQAMQVWSSVTSLTFTEVTSAANADIVIKWAVGDHGDGAPFDAVNGVLAHAFFPPPNGAYAGDLHFDDSETWTTSVQYTSSQPIDLVTVAIHELGHSLGLQHSNVPGAIMYAYYNGSQRTLSTDDIQAISAVYPKIYSLYGGNPVCGSPSQTFVGLTPSPPAGSSIVWSTSPNLTIAMTLPPNTPNTAQINVQSTVGNTYQTGTVTATINGVQTITRTVDIGEKPLYFGTKKTATTDYTEYCDNTYHYVPIDIVNSDNTVSYNYTFGNFSTGISNPGITYTQINSKRYLFKIPLNKIPSGTYPVFSFSVTTNTTCTGVPYTIYGQVVTLSSCNGTFAAKTTAETSAIETSAIQSEDRVTIYPNPATNILNISVSNSKNNIANAKIIGKLYDLNGSELTQISILSNTASLDVSKFKKGIYILKVDINGEIESHQIIIQ